MQLTFHHGKFVLKSSTFQKSPSWNYVGAGLYETTNLGAAAAFKSYSDVTAERVFKRALTVYYKRPCLPQLSFLDPHQREGIEWILSRSRSYLAHAPGAGKTCQAIVASLLYPKFHRTLFIVPPTLTQNWMREVAHFSNLMGISSSASIVPTSNKRTLINWEADFIICPDSMLTKDWVYSRLLRMKPNFIAVDEASRFKEPTSQRSKAFYGGKINEKFYPGLYQDSRYVVFLDGSPMPNRSLELWAPTYALNPRAIDYMGYFDFGLRYGGPTIDRYTGDTVFKGSSNEAELKEKLQKDFMHVVTEDKLNHPERLRSILYMNEEHDFPESSSLPKNISESKSLGSLAAQRKEIGIFKTDWVSRYVTERLKEKKESILLFAWHREVCEILATKLQNYKPAIIYGGTSNEKREQVFRDFQTGKTSLIIGNIQAMGRGHNLQKAGRVVFAEYSWTDELNRQCEKRASRRGSKKAFVRCDYIVLPDSLDEVVLSSVYTKEKRVTKIVG